MKRQPLHSSGCLFSFPGAGLQGILRVAGKPFPLLQHEPDDLPVGLPHAFLADVAHTADGLVGVLPQDAVVGAVAAAGHGQVMGQHGGVQAGGDLGGAAGLGAVADDAGDVGQRVVDGGLDLVGGAAVQVGDGSSRRAGGGYRPAEGAELADVLLLVDGEQSREGQGTVELFGGEEVLPGVDDDRHRGGDALVAAAGIDDDRHVAARHTGLRGGGRIGTHPGEGAVGVGGAQHPADAHAVVAAHALVGDLHVAADLPLKDGTDGLQGHRVGILLDGVDGQLAAVGLDSLAGLALAPRKDRFPVFQDGDDVGVGVAHLHRHRVRPVAEFHDEVEGNLGIQEFHLAVTGGDEVGGLLAHRAGDRFQHFHPAGGVTAEGAQADGGLDAGHPPRVGDLDAADILDHVAAAPGQNAVGLIAQHLPGAGGGVGQGDGLGAAHRWHQFFGEDGGIHPVEFFRHGRLLSK